MQPLSTLGNRIENAPDLGEHIPFSTLKFADVGKQSARSLLLRQVQEPLQFRHRDPLN